MSLRKYRDMRRQFSRACHTVEIEDTKSITRRLLGNIKDHQEGIRSARAALYFHSRALALSKKAFSEGKIPSEFGAEHFAREFDMIWDNPRVKRVFFEEEGSYGPCLHVFTDKIFCVNPSTKSEHEIGCFRISLNIAEISDISVQWFNLDRKIDGFEHPHIPSSGDVNGNVCLGDAVSDFTEWYAQGRISDVITLAIRFVECVNPGYENILGILSKFPERDDLKE
jgi:hypothetical protein